MDVLLAGNEPSLWKGRLPALNVQRCYLWKSFRAKSNTIPGRAESVRLPPGILFAFIPESCSESTRNAVRLHPGMVFALARYPHTCTTNGAPLVNCTVSVCVLLMVASISENDRSWIAPRRSTKCDGRPILALLHLFLTTLGPMPRPTGRFWTTIPQRRRNLGRCILRKAAG